MQLVEKVGISSDTSRTLFPDVPHILLFRFQWTHRLLARAGPRRHNNSPRRKRRDARQDRQPIRPRIRGISSWHQKSEYETQRKLHDVIIVLWECLEWSEYHNTGVAHSLWELLLQILQSTTVVVLCPVVNSHVAFTRVPAKPNFFACVPFRHGGIALVSSTNDALPLLRVVIIGALSSRLLRGV